MHVYVVLAHPSKQSFTYLVFQSFIAGLGEAGHTFEVGDLYEMQFQTDMDLAHYERETSFDATLPIPADVAVEQDKLERADGLVLIYPLWWSDCPAKLKGWFDRLDARPAIQRALQKPKPVPAFWGDADEAQFLAENAKRFAGDVKAL